MRTIPPNISPTLLGCAVVAFALSCTSENAMVLDSDIPNVVGLDPIVTRDIERQGGIVTKVEVIYRGDIADPATPIGATSSAFAEHGWRLVSQQSREKTSTLYFAKDSRQASVQIALNQIDPMMSPAVLRVGAGMQPGAHIDSPVGGAGAAIPTSNAESRKPEGFAPPPL